MAREGLTRRERSRRERPPRRWLCPAAAGRPLEEEVNRRDAAVGVNRANGHLANIVRGLTPISMTFLSATLVSGRPGSEPFFVERGKGQSPKRGRRGRRWIPQIRDFGQNVRVFFL